MKVRILLAVALVAGLIGFAPAQAAECATGEGTEWLTYGGPVDNSRTQWGETALDASTVGGVEPAWIFDAEAAQLGGGTFSNTPVVVDGCVYLGSSSGFVFALNAETGEQVWKSAKLPGQPAGALVGGVITGSPVVAAGKVYVGVSRLRDPFVAVFDQETGAPLGEWSVLPEDVRGDNNQHRNTVIASPVYYDGMIFQGIMADEASNVARGAWSILDAETGEIITFGWTIPDNDYAHGYRGASIWCSPALDDANGFLYACGGNPASKKIEHRNSNALLRFDLNRLREDGSPNPNFGKLVDAYKGDVDQYYPGLDRQPVCDAFGDQINVVWSQACLQLDLDFGSSPNLFTLDIGGEPTLMLGALQKSGIYHVLYADTMQRAWTTIVGTPCFACNAGSSAYDDNGIYIPANLPGQVVSLTKEAGRYRWATPVLAGTYFQAVSTANGVVYSMDNYGNLNAWDASTGVPALKRNLMQDTGEPTADLSSQGIAIARNTIFATSSRFVVAYRLP